MSQDAIIIDVALDAPPGLVWRALTEPALLARWLGANDVEARIGRRFTLESIAGKPPVDCEVIEVEPDRLLSYRWREAGEGVAVALDSVVTWVLDPTPEGGTRLRLVHDGFPISLQEPARAFIDSDPSPLAGEGSRRRRSDEGSHRPRRLAPPDTDLDLRSPSSICFADTVSRKGRRNALTNQRRLAWAA